MYPPLCQNTADRFILEHHHRALDTALTSAHPDSVCSNKFTLRFSKSPLHPLPSPKTTRGAGYEGVGYVSWDLFVFLFACFMLMFDFFFIVAQA